MRTLSNGDRRLNIIEFSRRFDMHNQSAVAWIDFGTAPATRIPGKKHYLILEPHVAAYERGEEDFWSERPAVIIERNVEMPYLHMARSGRRN